MYRDTRRIPLSLATVILAAIWGLALFAGPRTPHDLDRNKDNLIRERETPPVYMCPTPACMAPCQLGGEPEVVCISPEGEATETTFTCCCCGGGGPQNGYRPI